MYVYVCVCVYEMTQYTIHHKQPPNSTQSPRPSNPRPVSRATMPPLSLNATWPKGNVFGTTRNSLDLSRMLTSLLLDLDCRQRQDAVMSESVCDLAEIFSPSVAV